MGFMKNGRVNIVIANHVLRYTYHKNATSDGLVTYGEVELPKDTIKDGSLENKQAFLDVLNQLVRKHKWKRKKLYFCIPDDTVVIRQLQIPASLTKEEAMGYVKTQIGHSFYLPFINPALALEFLDDDKETRNILLYAYPKEKITAFEEAFEKAALKPVAADLTSLSVYRYFYKQKKAEKDHVLLVHWNRDALVLTAFHRHKAVFTRHMNIESSDTDVSEESAQHLINEYVIEINRIIDFYQFSITKGESSINMLLLSGDFSFLKLVKSTLADTVTLPVHSFSEEELSTKYIDVLGLAQKQDG